MTNKKSKIPYILLLFFVIVVAVNVGYLIISKDSLPGVATDNSYNKGIKYNQTIAQKEAQEKLGWNVDINIKQNSKNSKNIAIYIRDQKGHLVDNAKVVVKFFRPTYEGIDFEVKFDEVNGFYQQEVKFPALGQWDFEISAIKGSDSFFLKKRFIIHDFSE